MFNVHLIVNKNSILIVDIKIYSHAHVKQILQITVIWKSC